MALFFIADTQRGGDIGMYFYMSYRLLGECFTGKYLFRVGSYLPNRGFELPLRAPKWRCGREARQSSAKAPTAVRVRSAPLKTPI